MAIQFSCEPSKAQRRRQVFGFGPRPVGGTGRLIAVPSGDWWDGVTSGEPALGAAIIPAATSTPSSLTGTVTVLIFAIPSAFRARKDPESSIQHGTPCELYAEVSAQFPGRSLPDLTLVVIAINAWNRVAVPFRKEVTLSAKMGEAA